MTFLNVMEIRLSRFVISLLNLSDFRCGIPWNQLNLLSFFITKGVFGSTKIPILCLEFNFFSKLITQDEFRDREIIVSPKQGSQSIWEEIPWPILYSFIMAWSGTKSIIFLLEIIPIYHSNIILK